MKEGLVSIIIPVYNAEDFLTETIESVQAQTYEYWELLLVDDCSSDSSGQIIEKKAREDDRIKYIKILEQPLLGILDFQRRAVDMLPF